MVLRNRRLHLAVAAVVASLGLAGVASADNWDGGDGTWSTSVGHWDGGGTWVQGNSATFDGTSGTVSLGEAINVAGMTFNADNYIIDLNGFALNQSAGTGFGGSITNASSIQITNTGALATYTMTGSDSDGQARLTGNMAVTFAGGSTWIPVANNTFTGTLTLNSGYLRADSGPTSLGSSSGTIQINGTAQLQLSANGTYSRNIMMNGAGAYLLGYGPHAARVTGQVSGGAINVSQTQGALVLAGDNDFTGRIYQASVGSIVIAASTNAFGATNTIDSTQNVVDGNYGATVGFSGGVDVAATKSIAKLVSVRTDGLGSVFNLDGENSYAGGISVGYAQSMFTTEAGSQLTLTGVVSGSRPLFKQGEGTLVLAGANTFGVSSSDFRRLARAAGGTLKLDFGAPTAPQNNIINSASQTTSSAAASVAGGTLEIVGKDDTDNSQYFNGLRVDLGASEFSITSGTNNNVNVRLGGLLARVTGGTVDFGLASGAQVSGINGFNTTKTNTNGIIGGYATVGGASWATSGASGTNAITAYTHTAAEQDATAFATAANNVDITDTNTASSVSTTSVNSLRFAAGKTLTIADGNTLTLTSGGILVTGDTAGVITGGTLKGAAFTTVSQDLVVNHFGTSDFEIASAISDNGGATALTKSGPGTLILSGTNDYSGTTYVNRGMIKLNSAGALSANSHLSMNGGIIGLTDNFSRTIGTGAANVDFLGSGGFAAYGGTRTVNLGTTVKWNGGTWGTGGQSSDITKGGLYQPGAFVGTNYKLIFGATDADGMVDFQSNINLGDVNMPVARIIQVIDSPTVAVEARISGIISGAGGAGLNKSGSGTLELAGVNTYTGETIVSAGALLVNGDGMTSGVLNAGSAVTVKSGATIGGTGAIKGSISILSGGTISPGASVESLDVGSLTLNSGSISLFEIDGTTAGTFDTINATGNVAFDGELQLVFSPAMLASLQSGGGGTWDLFNAASTTGNFSAISSNLPGGQFQFNPATGELTVPEPGILSLLAASGMLLGLRRRHT